MAVLKVMNLIRSNSLYKLLLAIVLPYHHLGKKMGNLFSFIVRKHTSVPVKQSKCVWVSRLLSMGHHLGLACTNGMGCTSGCLSASWCTLGCKAIPHLQCLAWVRIYLSIHLMLEMAQHSRYPLSWAAGCMQYTSISGLEALIWICTLYHIYMNINIVCCKPLASSLIVILVIAISVKTVQK